MLLSALVLLACSSSGDAEPDGTSLSSADTDTDTDTDTDADADADTDADTDTDTDTDTDADSATPTGATAHTADSSDSALPELWGDVPAVMLPPPNSFVATSRHGNVVGLSDLVDGQPTVMWFYPAAATGG